MRKVPRPRAGGRPLARPGDCDIVSSGVAHPSRSLQRVATSGKYLGGGNEDARRLLGTGSGPKPYDDLNVASQPPEKVHQPLDGEAIQPIARKRRYFGLVDSQFARSARLGKTALRKDVVNGHGEPHLSLFLLGVRKAEIGENISGTLEDPNLTFFLRHNVLSSPSGRVANRPLA